MNSKGLNNNPSPSLAQCIHLCFVKNNHEMYVILDQTRKPTEIYKVPFTNCTSATQIICLCSQKIEPLHWGPIASHFTKFNSDLSIIIMKYPVHRIGHGRDLTKKVRLQNYTCPPRTYPSPLKITGNHGNLKHIPNYFRISKVLCWISLWKNDYFKGSFRNVVFHVCSHCVLPRIILNTYTRTHRWVNYNSFYN